MESASQRSGTDSAASSSRLFRWIQRSRRGYTAKSPVTFFDEGNANPEAAAPKTFPGMAPCESPTTTAAGKLGRWLLRARLESSSRQVPPHAGAVQSAATPPAPGPAPRAPAQAAPAAPAGGKLGRWTARAKLAAAPPAPVPAPPSPEQAAQAAPAGGKLVRWTARAKLAAAPAAPGPSPPAPAQAAHAALAGGKLGRWAARAKPGVGGEGVDGGGAAVAAAAAAEAVGTAAAVVVGAVAVRDEQNGYHCRVKPGGTRYCGEFRDGQWWGQGSIRGTDGSQYHGEFEANKLHGCGRYQLPDGSAWAGRFRSNCPVGPGRLISADGVLSEAEYGGDKPFWLTPPPAPARRTLLPLPNFRTGMTECVALSVGEPVRVPDPARPGQFYLSAHYPNNKEVASRLLFARPPFADEPLWNAAEVTGRVVAIMRGPPLPAVPVPYAQKLRHAQEAGAVGVIFVDHAPLGRFDMLPRMDPEPGQEPPRIPAVGVTPASDHRHF